jgi:hypothetical protein
VALHPASPHRPIYQLSNFAAEAPIDEKHYCCIPAEEQPWLPRQAMLNIHSLYSWFSYKAPLSLEVALKGIISIQPEKSDVIVI